MRPVLFTVAIASALALPWAAHAQTCTVSVTPVNFGNYSPFAAALDSTGQVSVNCTGVASYTVTMNAGIHGGGSFVGRRMSNGQSALSYQLYSDAARTMVWGDGSGGSTSVSAPSSGALTVYGRVPARQNVSAGAYSDTILVTIDY